MKDEGYATKSIDGHEHRRQLKKQKLNVNRLYNGHGYKVYTNQYKVKKNEQH